MKKYFLLMFPILLVCLLFACTPVDQTEPDGDTSSAVDVDADTEQPMRCERVDLYDDGQISLGLLYGMDPETGKKTLYLRMENTGKELVSVKIAAPVINGVLAVDDARASVNAGAVQYSELKDWMLEAFYADETVIRSVSGTVQLIKGYGSDAYAEKECQAVFEKEGRGFLCDRLLNADIPPQVLLDNDNCRVTLLCFGRDPTLSSFFSGILYAENKTNGELPVLVNGLTVNGRTVEVHTMKETLLAKGAAFGSFGCKMESLEEQRITGIGSVSLLILTDQEENTGSQFFQKGGSWHPLTVENPDDSPETAVEEGTLLVEKEGVRIRQIGAVEKKEFLSSDMIRYEWNLFVENERDENIDIVLAETENMRDDNKMILSCIVASQSTHFCRISTGNLPADTACPQRSVVFRIREYGGTRVLFDSDPIVLSADAPQE